MSDTNVPPLADTSAALAVEASRRLRGEIQANVREARQSLARLRLALALATTSLAQAEHHLHCVRKADARTGAALPPA